MPWTLIADAVVAVLLVVTLVYVRRFSRQIEAIRSSRGEFEKLIADLTKSTDQAASHLHQFKTTAEAAGTDLQARVDRVQVTAAGFERLGDDLRLLTERAESAASRLEAAIARSRPGAAPGAAPVPTPPLSPAPAAAFAGDDEERKVANLGALSGLR